MTLASVQPTFLDLKTLAAYSSCSVRWLRDRLVDRAHPMPHYRIGGKLLVKREDFDNWMEAQRVVQPSDRLSLIVDSVMTELCPPRRVA